MAQLPTLCEVKYDLIPSLAAAGPGNVGDNWDIWPCSYRLRAFAAADASPDDDAARNLSPYPGLTRPQTQISNYPTRLCPSRACASVPPPGDYERHEGFDIPRYGRRAQTAPVFASLPVLHQQPRSVSAAAHLGSSAPCLGQQEGGKQKEDKLQWIESLNSWVPEKESQNPVPYTSFVSSLSFSGKYSPPDFAYDVEAALPSLPCDRYVSHMHLYQQTARSLQAQKEAQRVHQFHQHQQREAERRALQEAKSREAAMKLAAKSVSQVKFERKATPPAADPEPAPVLSLSPSLSPMRVSPTWEQQELQEEEAEEEWEAQDECGVIDHFDVTLTSQEAMVISHNDSRPDSITDSLRNASISDDAVLLPDSPSPIPSSPRQPSPPAPPSPSPREPTPPLQASCTKPGKLLENVDANTSFENGKLNMLKELDSKSDTQTGDGNARTEEAIRCVACKKGRSCGPCQYGIRIGRGKKLKIMSENEMELEKAYGNEELRVSISEPVTKPLAELKTPKSGSQMKQSKITHVKHSRIIKPAPKPLKKLQVSKKPDTGKKKSKSEKPKAVGKSPRVVVNRPAPLALLANSDTTTDEQVAPSTLTDSQSDITLKSARDKQSRWRAQTWKKPPKEASQESDSRVGRPKAGAVRKSGGWIYDSEDFSPEPPKPVKTKTPDPPALPSRTPTPVKPATPSFSPPPVQQGNRLSPTKVLPDWARHRWGPKRKDLSLADELKRQELAEERRKKAQLMHEALRKKRHQETEPVDLGENAPRFEDYGFLAKYCIFNRGSLEMYRKAFDVVDEDGKGYLTQEEALTGLRALNSKLTESEECYLMRILGLTGYNPSSGADFKLFAVMAAFSQKIAALDRVFGVDRKGGVSLVSEWMKNILGRLDFRMLEMKMFMCKTLWECNVDPETNRISLDQLFVELRAGGISRENEREVHQKLGHMAALDLLDFLTYVPLFIMVHESVVSNPLDDSRHK